MTTEYNADVVVVGGGIAGLWVLNQTRQLGYKAILVEKNTLGSGQTLACQGMIHGGQKYGGDPLVRKAIADMPACWDACMKGEGKVDLRGARSLSANQYMWVDGWFPNFKAHFAAKRIQEHTDMLRRQEDWPLILRENKRVKAVLRLHEKVLDVRAVLEALKAPYAEYIYKADVSQLKLKGKAVAAVDLSAGDTSVSLAAAKYVFCSGAGNQEIARMLGMGESVTQRRPLKQILIRNVNTALYGHCVGFNSRRFWRVYRGLRIQDAWREALTTTRVTITAHPKNNGSYVWYLGGEVAECRSNQTDREALIVASKEMRKIFPQISWSDCDWAVYPIDRAEPYDEYGRLPSQETLKIQGNAALAWPVKMTFAPALAERVIQWLKKDLQPGAVDVVLPLPKAVVGAYPWETSLNWVRIRPNA